MANGQVTDGAAAPANWTTLHHRQWLLDQASGLFDFFEPVCNCLRLQTQSNY
jgi:hypothetical protein